MKNKYILCGSMVKISSQIQLIQGDNIHPGGEKLKQAQISHKYEAQNLSA